MKREFEFDDGSSHKFWHIELDVDEYTVRYGKVGNQGQSRTKGFDSEETARKAFEKQITAKLKAGYQENGTPPPEEEAEEERPIFSSKIIRSMDLTPEEKSIASWEEPFVIEKPALEPFDYDDCLQRLKKVISSKWNWNKANITPNLTKEEAGFWLWVFCTWLDTPKKLHSFEDIDVYQSVDIKDAASCANNAGNYGVCLFSCIAAYFPPEDIVTFDEWPNGEEALAEGFRTQILPRLTTQERVSITKKLKGNLQPHLISDCYESHPATHAIAGHLGMHNEMVNLLKHYPDNRLSGFQFCLENVGWMIFGLKSPEAVESELRRLKLSIRSKEHAIALFATTGHNALDLLVEGVKSMSNKSEAEEIAGTLHKVHSPEAAEAALQLLAETKAAKIGIEWLKDHPVATAVSLPPIAMGKGKLAAIAKDQLSILVASDNAQALEAALPNQAEATAAWVKKEYINNENKRLDPVKVSALPKELQDELAKVKTNRKLPDWASPQVLPTIKIAGGKLGKAEVEKVLCDLKVYGVEGDSILGARLREAAEATSLDAFAWKVCESWLNLGAPPKDKWALGVVGHLGGDHCVFQLTPLVREWPGQSQHKRAVLGLDCLRRIGSDTALMALNGIAQKIKYKGLKEKANLRMQEIAKEKGMTAEQLADRIVPDCGLDEKGNRIFDFGPRKFDFVFNSQFKPAVRDEKGKVRANLPKPNLKDDPEIAEIALAEWKLLKKTLREALKIQNVRMEEAMITGRRWTVQDFQTHLLGHPLMVHLVRTLVWGGYDTKTKKLKATFRVTEDNSISDSEDEDSSLPKDLLIGVVHPAHLSEIDKSNWGEILSDYEVIPPFEQLGRGIYTAEKDDLEKTEIKRFKKTTIPGYTLYGILERTYWSKDTPADGGGFSQHSKYFPSADVTAFIQYDPGLAIGWYDEPQKITSVYFIPGYAPPEMWGHHKNKLKVGKVDSVVLSEVLRMVHVLVSKGE